MKRISQIVLMLLGLACTLVMAQTTAPESLERAQQIGNDRGVSIEEIPQLISRMKVELPGTREHGLNRVSEAYAENNGNPALRIDRMWVNEQNTLIELTGLRRKGNKFSAILDVNSLYLLDLNSNVRKKFLMNVGGKAVDDPNGRQLVHLSPDEKIFLFFEPVADINPQSLRYTNWTGAEDRYFDKIDPLFRQRYDASFQKASVRNAAVEDMKNFLLEFVSNDPDNRAKNIFIELIQTLRTAGTFDGYYQAYKLVKDPSDEQAAAKLAKTPDQQEKLAAAVALVRAAEASKLAELNRAREARQAELRRRDEARIADMRKQEVIQRQAEQQANVEDAEARCMRTPSCRRSWEAEQAKCGSTIQACRDGCDRLSGAGSYSSWISSLVAAGMSRACYGGCKCGSGFTALLGKTGGMLAESPSSNRARSEEKPNDGKQYQCKVYCKSANGPITFKTVTARSKKQAAEIVGDSADEICANDGLSYSSSKKFNESQCTEK